MFRKKRKREKGRVVCVLCGKAVMRYTDGSEEEIELKSLDVFKYGVCNKCWDREAVERKINEYEEVIYFQT